MPSAARGLQLKAQKVQYVQNADDSEIYQSLQQQASIFELYRRSSDSRDLLRLHGSVGALDEGSAQRHHGGCPLITHVSRQETNKCASSQTLP
jgi:hypothetical protein